MKIADFDQIYVLCVDYRYEQEYPRIKKLLEQRGGKVRKMLNGAGKILPREEYDTINDYAVPAGFNGNRFQYYNLYNTKKIFKDAIANGYEHILICEDDLIITDNFDEILNKASPELPDDWDLFYLGFNRDVYPFDQVSEHIIRVRAGFTTHCFGVRKTLFQILVDTPENCGFDVVLHNHILAKYNSYALLNDIALQRPGFSYIWSSYQDYTTYFHQTGVGVYDD